MEDTTAGRKEAQEFGIVRWASAVPSVMVHNATNGGALLTNADESPTIARDDDGNSVGNGGAGASARGGSALGRPQNARPITQQKQGVETASNDEDDWER